MSADILAPPGPGPPTYAEAWGEGLLQGVICKEFPPKCLGEGGILAGPIFESFEVLVTRVNAWLKEHPQLCVKNLETVEYKGNCIKFGCSINTNSCHKLETPQPGMVATSILRVWVGPVLKSQGFKREDQIGYLNAVPACLHPGNILNNPQFDTLAVTMEKLQTLLRHRPIPGTVLNVETVQMLRLRQFSRNWILPDRTHWRDHLDSPQSILSFFRIYYRAGPVPRSHADIKFHDVVPNEGEGHLSVMNRANLWLQKKVNVTLLNFETISVPSTSSWKAQKSLIITCRLHGKAYFVRIWYLESSPGTQSPEPPYVYCKVILPKVYTEQIINGPSFQDITDLKRVLVEWQDQNKDKQVVSVQTSSTSFDVCSLYTSEDESANPDDFPMLLCKNDSLSTLRIFIAYYIE